MNDTKGLYTKYTISHSDGHPVNAVAKYFVLRYDGESAYAVASRKALMTYAEAIQKSNKKLAEDLEIAAAEAEQLAAIE